MKLFSIFLEVANIQPLRIIATLADGRVAGNDPWFPLDALLAASWLKINVPELIGTPITDFNNVIEADLPLKKLGDGDDWYWACSFNRGVKLGEYIKYYHKRFDDQLEQYLTPHAKKIDVQRGKFKAGRIPLTVMLFDRLIWYAVGDADAIRTLCSRVTHIGKKPSQGFGVVAEWQVEPWPEDWSIIDSAGNLTRAIPTAQPGTPPSGRIEHCPIRPPYWLVTRRRLCYIPEVTNASDMVP